MHRFLKKSTVHEKQGLLSVIQDDRNVPIAIDTAVTGSLHDDTTSEPLIQLAHAHACTYIFDYYLRRVYNMTLAQRSVSVSASVDESSYCKQSSCDVTLE